jgi:tripartite-type tricarboxylate transporter receptor subunit TctC
MKPTQTLSAILAGVFAIFGCTASNAQEWPSRPILVVSPLGEGTTAGIVAKEVLDQVGQQIGQPFNIVNRTGGGNAVGVVSVVKAAPDGYTFLISSSSMTSAIILHKSLPYDTLRDLEPVAIFGGEPSMLVAAPGKGFLKLADLIAAAKAKPGELKFGSVGIGSASHIVGEQFRLAAGLDVRHVPYPGASEALADLKAGRIDFYFLPVLPALPLITEGNVVPLAVSTPNRLQSLPGLPTLAESGYSVANYLTWVGLSAPAKTPHEIVDKLNAAIGKSLGIPAIRTKLLRTGFQPMPMNPEQFATFVAKDVSAMIKLGKDARIEPLD